MIEIWSIFNKLLIIIDETMLDITITGLEDWGKTVEVTEILI